MHRSGTSLTAKWLRELGVNIGENLLPPEQSNPQGHYEDLDFLNFHNKILRKNGLGHSVYGNINIHIDRNDFAFAKRLVEARAGLTLWGWKEPRTCLFLDFWKGLLPQSRFFFVFRSYDQVVNSLKRREGTLRMLFPVSLYKDYLYSRVWQYYNKRILDFVEKNESKCMIFDIEDLIRHSILIADYMEKNWNLPIKKQNIEAFFKPELFHNKRTSLQKKLCKIMLPSIDATLSKLQIKSIYYINIVRKF